MKSNKLFVSLTIALLLSSMFFTAYSNFVGSGIIDFIIICVSVVAFPLLFANSKKHFLSKKLYVPRNMSFGKVFSIFLITSLLSISAFAADATTATTATTATGSESGLSSNLFLATIIVELLIIIIMLSKMKSLQAIILNPTLGGAQSGSQKSWFWDKFNSAVEMDKEEEILMDHSYDGIKELDNSLPPWWKYGFYITIVIACVYFFRYQVTHSAPNSKEEYEAEMKLGDEQKAAYLAKAGNSVDENTVTLLTDEASLLEGKSLFQKNCSPCHLPDGGGLVGPNLTDEYWIHGGSIKNVFKSIKYGWLDKGMKSWKDDFSPKQIQELASFVKSLKGTKPANPKAPQGDLYKEEVAVADTVKK